MSDKMEGYASGGAFLNAKRLVESGLKNKQMTIASVEWTTIREGEPEKPVLSFEGKEEKLALNKGNAVALIEAYGPDETKWVGKTLVMMITKKNYQGQMVDSITVAV